MTDQILDTIVSGLLSHAALTIDRKYLDPGFYCCEGGGDEEAEEEAEGVIAAQYLLSVQETTEKVSEPLRTEVRSTLAAVDLKPYLAPRADWDEWDIPLLEALRATSLRGVELLDAVEWGELEAVFVCLGDSVFEADEDLTFEDYARDWAWENGGADEWDEFVRSHGPEI